MTTLTTIAPTIDDSGVSAPTYYEAVDYLKAQFQSIYGSDIYLENDSQDGQMIGVFSRVIADIDAAIIALYGSFSPKTATKEALSRNVAINGITRAIPTYSTVDVILVGVSGTTITNGYVIDTNNNTWMLPASVVIPSSGQITVTATAKTAGAILALAGTVTIIGKPTRGWQSVTNAASSNLGAAVEQDYELRQRQSLSVAIPSQSKTDGLRGALLGLTGVTRCKIYENDENTTDSNGIPANKLCVVIYGGDSAQIAQTMQTKKSMGCGWYGNTTVPVLNSFNDPINVQLHRPTIKNIGFYINLQSTINYTSEIGVQIQQSISDYINNLSIGDKISITKTYTPANLYGVANSLTYEILSIQLLVDGVVQAGDYELAFDEIAYCSTNNIEINISGG
ncbi:baseplate J/gp47 family protein [Acinetobacter baumannii]